MRILYIVVTNLAYDLEISAFYILLQKKCTLISSSSLGDPNPGSCWVCRNDLRSGSVTSRLQKIRKILICKTFREEYILQCWTVIRSGIASWSLCPFQQIFFLWSRTLPCPGPLHKCKRQNWPLLSFRSINKCFFYNFIQHPRSPPYNYLLVECMMNWIDGEGLITPSDLWFQQLMLP